MKWMGGWSVEDYENASSILTEEIVAMMLAEHETYQAAKEGRSPRARDVAPPRGRGLPADVPEAAKAQAVEIDPKTGREVVTLVKPDGTIVKHRKIEEGEMVLHRIFGRPKSFQNK